MAAAGQPRHALTAGPQGQQWDNKSGSRLPRVVWANDDHSKRMATTVGERNDKQGGNMMNRAGKRRTGWENDEQDGKP